MATQTRTPSSNNLRRLRRARKESKTVIFSAKEEWTTTFAKSMSRACRKFAILPLRTTSTHHTDKRLGGEHELGDKLLSQWTNK